MSRKPTIASADAEARTIPANAAPGRELRLPAASAQAIADANLAAGFPVPGYVTAAIAAGDEEPAASAIEPEPTAQAGAATEHEDT